MTMKLKILTPAQEVTVTEADQVVAYGPKGEFGILPGHAHYVSPLSVGRLVLNRGGKSEAYLVSGGYLEVLGDEITVAADHVETAGQIDATQSQQHLKELEQKLGGDTLEPGEFDQLAKDRDLEQARLSVVS